MRVMRSTRIARIQLDFLSKQYRAHTMSKLDADENVISFVPVRMISTWDFCDLLHVQFEPVETLSRSLHDSGC
jgi:hypothetical protein